MNKNTTRLVDQSGKEFPTKNNFGYRLRVLTSNTKIIFTSILASLALLTGIILNYGQIREYLKPAPESPSVPEILLKLTNSASDTIDVFTRNDFFLSLPSLHGRYSIGKYEFKTLDNKSFNGDIIAINPGDTVVVNAYILNQELYGILLKNEECDITLYIRQTNGSITCTQTLPFSSSSIKKYFLTTDVIER